MSVSEQDQLTHAAHRSGGRRAERSPSTADRRGDIQGLRAVAVLLVMLDHGGVPGLAGGYVGVDVFFVISGFLITGILVREVRRTGRVSIADFYARRARRILPAASVVLLAIALVSSQLFSYLRISDVMTDVTWAAFFAANIHSALSGTDYFAATTFVSPVQHFWSLAVEEQFYLVWPALIALIVYSRTRRGSRTDPQPPPDPARTAKRLRRVFVVVGVLCALSLVWSVWRTAAAPGPAYYSTLARAWELGLGAVLALAVTRVGRLPVAVKLVASWVGVGAIAWSALTYSSSTPFPGYHALLPVGGAFLVLAGGTAGSRYGARLLLDRQPLRWIGDISFSLYLWHWPFLVMPVIYLGRDLRMIERVGLMAAAIAVSAVSYYLVETPIRRAPRLSRSRVLSLAMWPVTAAVVIAAAVVVQSEYGKEPAAAEAPYVVLPTVKPTDRDRNGDPIPAAVGVAAGLAQQGAPLPEAFKPSLKDLWGDVSKVPVACAADRDATSHQLCALGDANGKRTMVVFGDSHMGMWLGPILTRAKERGWKVVPFLKGSCFPADLTEWRQDKNRLYTECDTYRRWAYGQMVKLKPQRIIISGLINQIVAEAKLGRQLSNEASGPVFETASRNMLKRLRQLTAQVTVIGGTPQLDKDPGDCLTTRRATMATCAGPLNPVVETRNRSLQKAAAATGAQWIDPVPWFCAQGICPVVVGNAILYRDTNHITTTYATVLHDSLIRRLGL